VSETAALLSKAIEVGCFDNGSAVTAETTPAVVIGKDENDVWFGGGGWG
jgi:hypothetical protein